MIRHKALLMLALLAGFATGATAEPEIYRCTQDDGTVAFQQMPCRSAPVAPPETRQADEPQYEEQTQTRPEPGGARLPSSISDSAPPEQTEVDPDPRKPVAVSGNRADCEKSARDAIDAIDAELQASGNPENDRARLDELLKLTRRLRLCKEL